MSKKFWKTMSVHHRIWYKEIFKNLYGDSFYGYRFWFFIANTHTSVRDWYFEFGESLPKNLPIKLLVYG
ncbi:hypothetical protein DTQ70_04125 [Runella sp. SP2]|nr:hypothetical protein DTQ70_04125 [Runella sp. SP2]